QAGMKDVVTYINTGNIIYSCIDVTKTEQAHFVEEAIHRDFGLQIIVVVRCIDDVSTIMEAIPDEWKNDSDMKSDIMFLWDEVDDEAVLGHLFIKPDIDTVKYVP